MIFLEIATAAYLIRDIHSKNDEDEKVKTIFFVWLMNLIMSFWWDRKSLSRENRWNRLFSENRVSWMIWFITLMLWLGIAVTKIGITPDDRFWNVAGVPVLPQQVVFTLLFIFFLLDLKIVLKSIDGKPAIKNFLFNQNMAYLLAIGIWLLAILVWNTQELRHTYFAPGPYPPNYERYPFSDASSFDIGSQYFLLGQGLNNEVMTDRPFLMLFFSVLHLLGGQNYDRIAFFQLIFYAIIPVFLFLLGNQIHSKIFGIGLALLAIFKEKNAILTANEIGLVNVKVMTSEMPATLFFLGFTITLIYWMESKNNKLFWAVLTGGLLGVSIGVRITPIFLTPLILLVIFIASLSKPRYWSKWVYSSLLFILSVVVVLTPYSIENIKTNGVPFWLFKITQAYNRSYQTDPISLDIPKIKLKTISPLLEISKGDDNISYEQTKMELSSVVDISLPENVITLSLRHFVHNELMTVFIYPLNYEVEDIREFIDKPYWDNHNDWEGQLQGGEIFLLGINLLVISFGIGFSIRHWKITGIAPLILHLGYNLANGGARTSGGRYIVPADWVIHIYFLLGVIAIIYYVRGWKNKSAKFRNEPRKFRTNLFPVVLVMIGFLAFGASFSFSSLFQSDYELLSGKGAFSFIQENSVFEQSEYFYDESEKLLQSKSGFVMTGLVLYPRYIRPGETVDRSFYIRTSENNQGSLYFRFLTDKGPKHINIVLGDHPIGHFEHAQFAVVLGCDRRDFVEGKFVVPLGDSNGDILESSKAQFSCD